MVFPILLCLLTILNTLNTFAGLGHILGMDLDFNTFFHIQTSGTTNVMNKN